MKAEIEEALRAGEAIADKVRLHLPIGGADALTEWNIARSKLERALTVYQPPTTKARSMDPSTSKTAALRAKPRAGSQRQLLYRAVAAAGPRGMTAEEAAKATGIRLNSASTRMSELVRGDWIAESAGGTRKTSGGEQAIVYIAKRQMAMFMVEVEDPRHPDHENDEEFPCYDAASAGLRVEDLTADADSEEVEELLGDGMKRIEWTDDETGVTVTVRRLKEEE